MTSRAGYKSLDWKYSEVRHTDREDENVSEEFFTEGDSLTEISALVRESMQNSLDAASDKSRPITMRFKIGEQMPAINHDYFDSIYNHAELSLQPNLLPKLNYKSKFLVIEDFNTAGLRGSISSLRPSPESSDKYGDNFWFFEWKSGETNKLRGGRGSWGIGKAVLSAASRMKTILVYSERDTAGSPKPNTESILFGHSIFKYATIDGLRLKPHRNWMREVQVEGESGEIDFEPTSLTSDIELFRSDWKIKRKSSEVGTSIVIPFIKNTITADSLIQCIIQDYFIAILDNSVICEVEDEDGNEFLIDKENIFMLIERIEEVNSSSTTKSKRELVGVCQMYENRITNQTFKYEVRASISDINDWSNVLFEETLKNTFHQEIEKGKTVEFIVKTEVPTERSGIYRTDQFSVLFSKYNGEGFSKTLFTRGGILIPDANPDSKLNGLLSIVIVDEGELDELQKLLRLAEGPAHKNWTANGDKVSALYESKALREVIKWVKASALSVFKKLQPDQSIPDDRSLAKYFPDDSPIQGALGNVQNESEKATGKPEGGKGGSGGEGNPRGGRLLRIQGGDLPGSIIICPIDATRLEKGMLFEIEFAYSLRGGNSFTAWDSEDFNLTKLFNESQSKGVKINFLNNKATIEIVKSEFEAVFYNFDPLRDVSVDARRVIK
jgi:hypothetical protein